jgi:hypothetical protein
LRRRQDQGNHRFRAPTIRRAGRQNSHDRIELAVDLHGLAENPGIPAKMQPKAVRQNHNVFLARFAFLGKKIAVKEESISQHRVVAGRGFHSFEIFMLVLGGDVEIVRAGGF